MSETNEAKSQYVVNDIDERIQRKNDSIGFKLHHNFNSVLIMSIG